MSPVLVHIVAGLAAIVAGAVALSAAKGGTLHRRSGIVFVQAMLVMAAFATALAALKFHLALQKMNFIAGIFTIYLVASAWATVRRDAKPGWIDVAGMLAALAIAIFAFSFGLLALGGPRSSWFPTAPALIFGSVALAAALGDFRMIRAGGIQGARRIVRHLWRMCFAMFVATGSFFLGQAKVFPEELRVMPVLAAPVVLVLLAMLYWWIRIAVTRRLPRARVNPMGMPGSVKRA